DLISSQTARAALSSRPLPSAFTPRSLTTMRAPCRASSSAWQRPSPVAPPVTMATLPSSNIGDLPLTWTVLARPVPPASARSAALRGRSCGRREIIGLGPRQHGYRPLLPLQPFDDRPGTHCCAAAHRDERGRGVAALELVERGHQEPRAGGADRVAERDRAA